MNLAAGFAALFGLIATIALLWTLSLGEKLAAATAANKILGQTNARLRSDAETARAEADTAISNRDQAVAETNRLRDELDKSLRWRNELRQSEYEADTYLTGPRNERRDAWTSLMHARFNAPDAIPPHEQPKDGDQ